MSYKAPSLHRKNNTTARVYNVLLKKLVSREYPPGTKISQSKLAEELKVSRTPLVKALHKLETQGLIDNIPGKGFYVHQLTVKELVDLFTLREALDTIIIKELSETIQPEQIAALEQVFSVFALEDSPFSAETYREADQEFHNLVLSYSQNDLVKKLNRHFQIFSRSMIAGLLREPSETLPEHMAIIGALKNKDRDAASAATITHVEKTRKYLEDAVNRLQKLGIDPRKITMEEVPKK